MELLTSIPATLATLAIMAAFFLVMSR